MTETFIHLPSNFVTYKFSNNNNGIINAISHGITDLQCNYVNKNRQHRIYKVNNSDASIIRVFDFDKISIFDTIYSIRYLQNIAISIFTKQISKYTRF